MSVCVCVRVYLGDVCLCVCIYIYICVCVVCVCLCACVYLGDVCMSLCEYTCVSLSTVHKLSTLPCPRFKFLALCLSFVCSVAVFLSVNSRNDLSQDFSVCYVS